MTAAAAFSLPTTFEGVRYRSRLEARWALFFRALELPARYELQPYQLSSGVYLPDFWLPTLHLHVEVKPVPHTTPQLRRCAELAHSTGYACALLVGTPDTHAHDVLHPSGRLERAALRFPAPAARLSLAATTARAARFA